MSKYEDYSPMKSLTRLREQMQRKISESGELVIPGTQVAPPLVNVTKRAVPCCVLLKSLTEGGPVPDDFKGLTTGTALKEHVRSDGAVYCGAFEVQGRPESVVLVFGDPALSPQAAQRLATLERPELERRHSDYTLGPFAHRSTVPAEPTDSLLS